MGAKLAAKIFLLQRQIVRGDELAGVVPGAFGDVVVAD
jgi:hypothetical protein